MPSIDGIKLLAMMDLSKNMDADNLAVILGSISAEGRKRLRDVAETLVAAQNRPGFPVPESIRREILGDTAGLKRGLILPVGQ